MLNEEQLNECFPFFIEFSNELKVTAVGSSLASLCPRNPKGVHLDELVRIERPQVPTSFDGLRGTAGQPVVLELVFCEAVLYGQILPRDDSLLFVGSLRVSDEAEIRKLGLDQSHFSAHDQLSDLLLMLRIQRTNLSELTELASKLKKRSEELETAREAAEAASRAKSRFLAHLSHELRTPLHAILGYCDLLLEESGDDLVTSRVRTVSHSGHHLLGLISDLLDVSSVELGNLKLESQLVDLHDVARAAVETVYQEAVRKGLDLNVNVDDDVPQFVIGDAVRLRQIVLNLLDNAIKFSERGSVNLEISCGENGTTVIEVSDSGKGIAEEALERIFGEFEQIEDSPNRGVGLGLSICRRLADLMSGEITVSSEVGRGSTFRCQLPLKVSDVSRLPGSTVRTHSGPEGVHVLLIEDVVANQYLVQTFLRKVGIKVETAGTGEAGVDVFRSANFDLVLVDMELPGIDGAEATRQMRAHEALGRRVPVPIVAVSAHAPDESREEMLEAGCDAYLLKPFNAEELIACISQFVGGDGIPVGESNGIDETEDASFEALQRVYLAGLSRALQPLENAIEGCDWNAVRKFAHDLKGTGGSYGFSKLTALGEGLSAAARGEEHDACISTLREIESRLSLIEDEREGTDSASRAGS